MPISAIAYTSEAAPAMVRTRLEALVQDAARFNGSAGVTGVLLFDGNRFLQYIEGPQDGVDVAYSRIMHARSHHDLIELNRGRVGQRAFPYWGMRDIAVDALCLSRIAVGDWRGFVRNRATEGEAQGEPSAMEQLDRVVLGHISVA